MSPCRILQRSTVTGLANLTPENPQYWEWAAKWLGRSGYALPGTSGRQLLEENWLVFLVYSGSGVAGHYFVLAVDVATGRALCVVCFDEIVRLFLTIFAVSWTRSPGG
jgi:hypothetical protein